MIERSIEQGLNPEDASQLLDQEAVADDLAQDKGWRRPLGWVRRAGQFFFALSFSSLTRRIVSLNLAGLVALVASILYLWQFRAGLIEARTQSLLVYAEIISEAIAASATVEGNTITIDPDRPLDLKPGESFGQPDESADFPINPERVAPTLRRLIALSRMTRCSGQRSCTPTKQCWYNNIAARHRRHANPSTWNTASSPGTNAWSG